ncbi:hypothetical protein ElyMa_005944300 [Elysia marginata]|uniref:Uncharacterized protein n=1 Tax=Elysia marginata TaxID=1093978 RepID=A0AAV4G945_9GAST|nr:hypothetical protein ElyMa_005944300 [Elysia marginata]
MGSDLGGRQILCPADDYREGQKVYLALTNSDREDRVRAARNIKIERFVGEKEDRKERTKEVKDNEIEGEKEERGESTKLKITGRMRRVLPMLDRLCGLAVKTLAQRSAGTGSIPGRVNPWTLKLLLIADPPGVWHYGFSAKSGRPGVRIM